MIDPVLTKPLLECWAAVESLWPSAMMPAMQAATRMAELMVAIIKTPTDATLFGIALIRALDALGSRA